MKRLTFILTSVLCILCYSCEKNNDPWNSGNQSIDDTGIIQCINNTSNPYTVKIKGNTARTFTLYGNKHIEVEVEYGFYTITVTQQSGYIFYPTEKTYECYVNAGAKHVVVSW